MDVKIGKGGGVRLLKHALWESKEMFSVVSKEVCSSMGDNWFFIIVRAFLALMVHYFEHPGRGQLRSFQKVMWLENPMAEKCGLSELVYFWLCT